MKQANSKQTEMTSGRIPLLAVAFAGILSCALMGCGLTGPVDHSGPEVPVPMNNGDEHTPSGGETEKQPGSTEPGVSPPPTLSPVAQYRLICEFPSSGMIDSISSLAPSNENANLLYLGIPTFSGEVITREKANVANVTRVSPVYPKSRDMLTLLVTASQEIDAMAFEAPAIYKTDIDLSMKSGSAQKIAQVVSLSRQASRLAARLMIDAKNYGSSDRGTYLIIPKGNKFDILRRADLGFVGRISLDPARTIDPRIYESQQVFAALVFDPSTKTFGPVVLDLQISANGILVAGTHEIETAEKNTTAVSLQRSGKNALTWSEVSTARSGVITPNTITIANYDLSSRMLQRASYKTSNRARMFPQVAVSFESGRPYWTVAVEKFTTSQAGARIEEAKLVRLAMLAGNLTEVLRLDYPADVAVQSASHGVSGAMMVSSLISADLGQEVFATLPTKVGAQIFKDHNGLLEAVGSHSCVHPSIIEELP